MGTVMAKIKVKIQSKKKIYIDVHYYGLKWIKRLTLYITGPQTV